MRRPPRTRATRCSNGTFLHTVLYATEIDIRLKTGHQRAATVSSTEYYCLYSLCLRHTAISYFIIYCTIMTS